MDAVKVPPDPPDVAQDPAAAPAVAPPRTPLRVLYRQVWSFAAGVRGIYALALVLLVGSQSIKLLAPWLAAQAINTIQAGGPDALRRAGFFTAAIFVVYIAAWSMHGPGRILERNVALRVRAGVSDALYRRLVNLPLAWHARTRRSAATRCAGSTSWATSAR